MFRLIRPRCGAGVESITHALWDCEAADNFWWTTIFGKWRRPLCKEISFGGVCLFMLKNLSLSELEFFCVFAWFLWKDSNSFVFKSSSDSPSSLIEDAVIFLEEFQKVSNYQ